jgi:hypothetical protein
MNRLYYYILSGLWLLAGIQAQAQSQITFFNQGKLYVKDSLFIEGDFQAEDNSEVFQKGRTVLTGDFINNVKTGHVFTNVANDNSGAFEFRGTAGQHIEGSAAKERFINFPDTLRINNQATTDSLVYMNPAQAATTRWVDIQRGRLVLESVMTPDRKGSVNAHLLIEQDVIGRANGIQVDLIPPGGSNEAALTGFTPPFERMYADYFFFNLLSRPTAKGLFGNEGRLITDPRTVLKPGLGYITGLGIVSAGYYDTELDPRWSGADYNERAVDKFSFSRAVAKPSFTQYVKDQPGAATGEKLLTKDVESIPIERGFNYLGNPYMTPLDLTDLVTGNTSASWGAPNNSLKKGFYVLTQGKGAYDGSKFTFSASYLIRQAQGSTYDSDRVVPMQMFIVGADSPLNGFKIPAAKRVHNSSGIFLRSATNEVTDELLIETTDNQTGGYDRLCLVFRPDATLSSGDPYDAVKIFNRSGGVNQIYTRSSDDRDMTVSVVPPTVDKLTMYFSPALLPQQVTLRADRLGSIVSVNYVILEDTKTKTLTDLKQTPSYAFTSSPSDAPDRFVLHFTPNPSTGADRINASAPQAHYEGGVLRISGLSESDRGTDVSLFNMQGQLLHRQPLTQTAPCTIHKNLAKGVYVVKNNATVIRFVVK